MKVSNSQKPADARDGVSRETSSKREREDPSTRSKEESPHKHGDPRELGKQAEG
jgi:hypothetical protein